MEKNLRSLPRLSLKVEKIRAKLKKFLPQNAGVYIFYHALCPIYIGKANSLAFRVLSYFGPNLETKTRTMIEAAESVSFIKVNSEFEALLLEASLIREYQPQYNIISKDDKHPLYIVITDENFPRVLSVRKLLTTSYNLLVSFGPFPNSTNVAGVLRTLRKVFPYSDHKIGKRGCIYSHIGLCVPCPSEVAGIKNRESRIMERKKYLKNIKRIKAVLMGKIDNVKNELNKEMIDLSKKEKYEEAYEVKKLIEKLEYITNPRVDAGKFLENPNLYDDLRNLEIRELGELLDLETGNLHRIECFDIAHLSGTFPTASMITFMNGEADKTLYRHFKIDPKVGGDDYASMKEVARRRINHLASWGTPDLIIVDGGLGQVKSFATVLRNNVANIPIVGIAKNPDRLIIGDKKIRLTGNALNLVQRIRDEAHRFARRLHHKLLAKSLIPKP